MTERYDPSFFFEKKAMLQELREQAVGESQLYQDFVQEVTGAYLYVLDLFRQFVDSYDERSRRRAWKRFKRAARKLALALNEAKTLMGDCHEAARNVD